MSDPSAIQLPVNQALTSDLLYGLKPSCPKSKSYRISVNPLNKNIFSGGDCAIFECPSGRPGSYLDNSQTYLKFSVQCSSTAAAAAGGSGIYLDNSAYSFIQRIDTYHGASLLESCAEYGQLANYILDTTLTQSDKAGLSGMIGTNYTNNFMTTGATYAQYGTQQAVQIAGDRSGMSLASVATASGISTAIPYVFTLPFFNSVIGVNASKMLPVGKLNSPVRLEVYWENNDNSIYYGSAGAGALWQLVNVELVLTYVELNDDIPHDPSVPMYISTKSWRNCSSFIPASSSGEITTLLPFRFASLTGIYCRFLNQLNAVQGANSTAAYRKGSSINPNFSQIYFRCGSSIIPNKPIYLINGSLVGTGSEGYAELMKSYHALSTSIGNTAITFPQYNVCATATQGWSPPYAPGAKTTGVLDTCNNGFSIAIELENFSNRSDTILSGVSTLNTQIFFTGVVNSGQTTGGTATSNITAHFFAQYDSILVLQDGQLSAKF